MVSVWGHCCLVCALYRWLLWHRRGRGELHQCNVCRRVCVRGWVGMRRRQCVVHGGVRSVWIGRVLQRRLGAAERLHADAWALVQRVILVGARVRVSCGLLLRGYHVGGAAALRRGQSLPIRLCSTNTLWPRVLWRCCDSNLHGAHLCGVVHRHTGLVLPSRIYSDFWHRVPNRQLLPERGQSHDVYNARHMVPIGFVQLGR